MDVPLKALHVMHIVREHHDAALGIHGVVIEFLAQPIPKLDRVIIQMRAFIIEIVGPDDGRVPARIAAADPAFFNDRNIGDAVFFGEVIRRTKAVAAAADNDCIISRLGRGIGPLFGPALMAAQCLSEKAQRTKTGQECPSTKGV